MTGKILFLGEQIRYWASEREKISGWWKQWDERRLFSLRKSQLSSRVRLQSSKCFTAARGSSVNMLHCATGCGTEEAILSARRKASSLPFMLTKTRRGWVSLPVSLKSALVSGNNVSTWRQAVTSVTRVPTECVQPGILSRKLREDIFFFFYLCLLTFTRYMEAPGMWVRHWHKDAGPSLLYEVRLVFWEFTCRKCVCTFEQRLFHVVGSKEEFPDIHIITVWKVTAWDILLVSSWIFAYMKAFILLNKQNRRDLHSKILIPSFLYWLYFRILFLFIVLTSAKEVM